MKTSSTWLALAVVVVVGGCSSSRTPMDAAADVVCDPPDEVVYSCVPFPPGERGCSGVPLAYEDRASVPDPDAVFAPGCIITLPFCHPFYPTFNATCDCVDATTPSGEPEWSCPL